MGQLEVLEFTLSGNSPAVGRRVRDLTFPRNSSIVAILREGQSIVPRGDTTLASSDIIVALTQASSEAELRRMLVG